MTYAGKTKVVLNQLKTMLDAVTGTQETFKGIPESVDVQVSVSISVGDREPMDRMAGYHETTINFFVEFAYRVQGGEGTAEDTLADWLDALEETWLASDRTFGGICRTAELDFSAAREPTYRPIVGDEFRVYPVVVRTTIPR
jgi:hypothetical protein